MTEDRQGLDDRESAIDVLACGSARDQSIDRGMTVDVTAIGQERRDVARIVLGIAGENEAGQGRVDLGPEFICRLDGAIDAMRLVEQNGHGIVARLEQAFRQFQLDLVRIAGLQIDGANVPVVDEDAHGRAFRRNRNRRLHRQDELRRSRHFRGQNDEGIFPVRGFSGEEQVALVCNETTDLVLFLEIFFALGLGFRLRREEETGRSGSGRWRGCEEQACGSEQGEVLSDHSPASLWRTGAAASAAPARGFSLCGSALSSGLPPRATPIAASGQVNAQRRMRRLPAMMLFGR